MGIPLHGSAPATPYKGDRLLKRALLVARFSPVMKISLPQGSGIADFQEDIRVNYPNVTLEHDNVIQFSMVDGEFRPEARLVPIWRFSDTKRHWRVSLSSETIAFEAEDGYTDRFDFAERANQLVTSVAEHFAPAQILRQGVRYVNCAEYAAIKDSVTPDLMSITGSNDVFGADLSWRFGVDEGQLILRSGVIPLNQTYDPMVLNPVEHKSWYLDIDIMNDSAIDFNARCVAENFALYIARAHAIFAWAVPNQKSN